MTGAAARLLAAAGLLALPGGRWRWRAGEPVSAGPEPAAASARQDAQAGADPPVAAWERDTGLRRAERIAMAVTLDRRAGVDARRTAAALAPALRRLTTAQLGPVAGALERMAAAEEARRPSSGG